MTTLLKIVATAVLAISFIPDSAFAFGLGGVTRVPKPELNALYLKEGGRVTAPFAHVVFCVHQPADCSASNGPDAIDLTSDKRRELVSVNSEINHDILPVNDSGNDTWSLAPREGDCEDFAITKRHALIAHGWPASALRLAVAHTAWGEGHLVLVVRTNKGDLVLDNLTGAVRNWRKTGLQWDMIQASNDPRIWHKL